MPGALTWDPTRPGGDLADDGRSGIPPASVGAVSGAGNAPLRYVGASQEQPAGVTKVLRKNGKLACNFTTGQWTINGGAPTLTQGYTGWDGAGVKTGVVSRTGQPAMLKVVPGSNASEDLTLGTFATNMLTKSLGGKIGVWVYVDALPGYQPSGTLVGSIELTVSTNAANNTNALLIGWNSNQVREGWNFLKFVMRQPLAYQSGSGVTEYHPGGVTCTGYGTGADTNIVASDAARLKIGWTNMSGATLYFDSIWTDFDTTPQICLGNDAGAGLLEYALPLFKSYGWVGYTAFPYRIWASGSKIIPDLNGNLNLTAKQLYGEGWECTNHTANHLANGTLTTEGEIAYELETARGWQYALGMSTGAEFYCSPQSSTSRLSEKVIASMGFKLQRNGRKWNTPVTQFGIDNPQNIGSIDMGASAGFGVASITGGVGGSIAGFQLASKIKRVVDIAIDYGDAVMLFWHGITVTGDTGGGEDLTGDPLLISKSAFEQVVAYIRTKQLAGLLNVPRGISGLYYGA